MSEYNLLWWQDRVVVIDVGQAVPLDHPHGEEWFRRVFFFQAEDGIRDLTVTGVQTCALPIFGEGWNQAVVVENRAGASGTIGTESAARAEPDGHSLFMATMGNMTANQHLYPKMAVDPLRAFAPITKVVDVHFVFLANPALAANS